MYFAVTSAQMKTAERNCDAGEISYAQMMENAGRACAQEIIPLADGGKKVVILCGSGNNGGDGLVISRILRENGIRAMVVFVSGAPKTDCAKANYTGLERNEKLPFDDSCFEYISEADIAVDCIYGTGFHGTLPVNAVKALNAARNCPIRVAVDIPSGINSDSGDADENFFKPTLTLVLAAMKTGLLRPDRLDILGDIRLLDIGIPEECYTEYSARFTDESFRCPFNNAKRSSHKGSFGHLLNIAGCMRYSGAAAMSTKSALRSGVGLCTLATTERAVTMLAPTMNEATYLPLPETKDGFISSESLEIIAGALKKATAVTVGCGMGNNAETRKIVEFVIKNAVCPIILDADGINSVSDNIDILKERKDEIILTPHPLEFSRISGLSVAEIQRGRIEAAKRFADRYGVTVVLKGANTVIASPTEVYVNSTGNAGLAKGGSGDTLTGIIGAMAAQGILPLKSAACGVYCHGLAADIAARELPREYMLAGDVIAALREVYRSSE